MEQETIVVLGIIDTGIQEKAGGKQMVPANRAGRITPFQVGLAAKRKNVLAQISAKVQGVFIIQFPVSFCRKVIEIHDIILIITFQKGLGQEIDIGAAVDIRDPAALGAPDEEGGAAHAAKCADGTVDLYRSVLADSRN